MALANIILKLSSVDSTANIGLMLSSVDSSGQYLYQAIFSR